MSVTPDEIKQILKTENTEFQELFDKHQNYEKDLEKMNGRPYLTSREQIEITNIKKHKLALKLKMEEMIQEHLRSPMKNG